MQTSWVRSPMGPKTLLFILFASFSIFHSRTISASQPTVPTAEFLRHELCINIRKKLTGVYQAACNLLQRWFHSSGGVLSRKNNSPGEIHTAARPHCKVTLLGQKVWEWAELSPPAYFFPGYHTLQRTVGHHILQMSNRAVIPFTTMLLKFRSWGSDKQELTVVFTWVHS